MFSRCCAAAVIIVFVLSPTLAFAQEAAPASETSIFIFNTLLFLFGGAMVFLMIVGFALYQAGLVRARNAAATIVAIVTAIAVASMSFWAVGYNLQFSAEPGGLLGAFEPWKPSDIDPVGAGAASAAKWFYAAMLAALGPAIIAGAVAGRMRIAAYAVFTALYAGFLYPVCASWVWGGGYLAVEWKFHDIAGAAVIHVAAGAAALAGALVIGPRRGRFSPERRVDFASNAPLAASGGFLIWISWFALIATARMTLASVGDAIAMSTAIANAAIAAAAAALAAITMTIVIHQKIDPKIALGGLIGGLVAISAEPLAAAIWQAALIGAMAGVIVAAGGPLIERLRIDDVANVVPTHLLCGGWGVLIAVWSDPAISLGGQIVGLAMIAGFSFVVSALIWIMLKYSIGVRPGAEAEMRGLDQVALGVDAYPEFRNG